MTKEAENQIDGGTAETAAAPCSSHCYTPGPWHFHDDEHSMTAEIHAEYNNGRPRHHVVAVADTVDWMGERLANAVANAKLISAAPELLSSLVDLVALVRGECPRLLDEDRDGDGKLSLQIDEVIAKARGV